MKKKRKRKKRGLLCWDKRSRPRASSLFPFYATAKRERGEKERVGTKGSEEGVVEECVGFQDSNLEEKRNIYSYHALLLLNLKYKAWNKLCPYLN